MTEFYGVFELLILALLAAIASGVFGLRETPLRAGALSAAGTFSALSVIFAALGITLIYLKAA